MQVIHKDKDKRDNSRETDSVGTIIYIERVTRYIKEEYIERFKDRNIRIYNDRRIFDRLKERIWKRR